MEQPSIFEFNESGTHDSQKSIDLPDETKKGSTVSSQNHFNSNSPYDEQTSNGNRPDHRPHNKPGHPTKKPSHSHHSESEGASMDRYDSYESSNPFSSPDPYFPIKQPDKTDDFDHADKSHPTPSNTFTLHFPEEQYHPTKNPDKSHYNERPRPNHQSDLNQPNHHLSSRPNGLNQNGFKSDESSPYDSNEASSFTPDNFNEFGPTNRPAHRPNSPSARPNHQNHTTRRVIREPTYEPGRGDIGIQSLDEKGRSDKETLN